MDLSKDCELYDKLCKEFGDKYTIIKIEAASYVKVVFNKYFSLTIGNDSDCLLYDILYNYDILQEFLLLNGFIIKNVKNSYTLIFNKNDINITIDRIRITYHSSIDIKTFAKIYDLIDYIKKCLCDTKICNIYQ